MTLDSGSEIGIGILSDLAHTPNSLRILANRLVNQFNKGSNLCAVSGVYLDVVSNGEAKRSEFLGFVQALSGKGERAEGVW